MIDDDSIGIAEVYRGVPVEAEQAPERVERVKAEIDAVHALDDLNQLVAYAASVAHAPESRMFAAAKIEVLFELCVEERRIRPAVDLLQVRAATAGLGRKTWRDPDSHCSLLDQPGRGADGAVAREYRLEDSE
jgi:hypothetical protein